MHESKQQMDRIEFLVEELSMAELLKVVLPRILPAPWELDNNYYIHPHEGKSDLKRSIPTKLRAYRKRPFSTCFVVIQDQDSNDCKQLKQELVDLCKANKSDNITYLVRIVCHELEAWYMVYGRCRGHTKCLSSIQGQYASEYSNIPQSGRMCQSQRTIKKNCGRISPD